MPVVMSDEFAAQVAKVVRETLHRERSKTTHAGRWQGVSSQRSYWAICNADIAAPTNGVTTPTTGQIEYLKVSDSGNLERTGETETLTHRWEGIELVENMLVRVMVAEDEVTLVAADCDAMGSPPA